MPDAATIDRARALHARAIIIDGHSDILMAVADHKMRLGTRVELPDHAGWQAPLGWAVDDPAPVADAALFLLSDLARATSGEIIHVDGGFHAVGAAAPSA